MKNSRVGRLAAVAVLVCGVALISAAPAGAADAAFSQPCTTPRPVPIVLLNGDTATITITGSGCRSSFFLVFSGSATLDMDGTPVAEATAGTAVNGAVFVLTAPASGSGNGIIELSIGQPTAIEYQWSYGPAAPVTTTTTTAPASPTTTTVAGTASVAPAFTG